MPFHIGFGFISHLHIFQAPLREASSEWEGQRLRCPNRLQSMTRDPPNQLNQPNTLTRRAALPPWYGQRPRCPNRLQSMTRDKRCAARIIPHLTGKTDRTRSPLSPLSPSSPFFLLVACEGLWYNPRCSRAYRGKSEPQRVGEYALLNKRRRR